MSGTNVITWSLDLDVHEWIAVPSSALDVVQWRADVATVFELLAAAEAKIADGQPLNGGILDIEPALDTLLEFSAALGEGSMLVAGIGLLGNWPLPVVVEVSATATNPGDLLDAAGARGGFPVDPPAVDDVSDGDGIRVTRLDLDDNGAILAQVSCARRADGADVVLTWRTSQLELVPQFSPLLEELLAHVTIETDP